MAYWLMKAEPNDYTFEDLKRDGVAEWDGIHNHQAANNHRHVIYSLKDTGMVGSKRHKDQYSGLLLAWRMGKRLLAQGRKGLHFYGTGKHIPLAPVTVQRQ